MNEMRTRQRALLGLVAGLVSVGMVGCGDDGETGLGSGRDADAGQVEGAGDAPGASGPTADKCSLLEVSEVEAQFGALGPVAEPYVDAGGGCIWEIGDQEGFGEPEGSGDFFGVNTFRGDTSMSLEETFGPGESIPDLGDEAWLSSDATMLVFRHGDLHVSLTTLSADEVDDPQATMIALAELTFDRL